MIAITIAVTITITKTITIVNMMARTITLWLCFIGVIALNHCLLVLVCCHAYFSYI